MYLTLFITSDVISPSLSTPNKSSYPSMKYDTSPVQSGIISTLFRSIFCSRFAFSLLSWLIYTSVVPVSPSIAAFFKVSSLIFFSMAFTASIVLFLVSLARLNTQSFISFSTLFMSVSYNREFSILFLIASIICFSFALSSAMYSTADSLYTEAILYPEGTFSPSSIPGMQIPLNSAS